MKIRRIIVQAIAFAVFLFLNPIFSQDDCKVLVPQLSGEYSGKCKKGFANGKGLAKGVDTYEGSFKNGYPDGKGEYIWSTGERYYGEWNKGKRDGVGTFYFIQDNELMEQEGMWIDDKYAGPVPQKPKVMVSTGIERYSIKRQGDGNRVQISTYINGSSSTDLEQLNLYGSSGSQFRSGGTMGYESVTFPFTCRISYMAWNKTHTAQNQKRFEFEIPEPGKWQVILHNN